jgi:hypothetical protein
VEPILHEQKPSARMKRLVIKRKKKPAVSSIMEDDNEEDNLTISKQSNAFQQPTITVEKSRAVATLAECIVVREKDFGMNDIQFTCMTHLGGLLAPGDAVLGYDLTNTNFNFSEEEQRTLVNHFRAEDHTKAFPDIILVRKSYERKGKERFWKLKNLQTQNGDEVHMTGKGKVIREETQYDADLEDFYQQVEADREMRQQMNLYHRQKLQKNSSNKSSQQHQQQHQQTVPMEAQDEDEEGNLRNNNNAYDDEEIRLDELLDEMSLNSEQEAAGLAAIAAAEDDARQERNARHLEEFKILTEEEVITQQTELQAALAAAVAQTANEEIDDTDL